MGKPIATIGAVMLAFSLAFPYTGLLNSDLPALIPPLGYNILAFGGIGLLVVGLLMMRTGSESRDG